MLFAFALQDLGGFFMVRRMLIGLRDRAERMAKVQAR